MKKKIFVVLVLSLVVGFLSAQNSDAGFGPKGLDELTKEKGVFKTTLINPDAVFSSYSKLCPARVLLKFGGPIQKQDKATTGSMVRK